MPGKMARSDARPSVRVTRALVAVSTSRLSCNYKRAGANANIDAGLGFIWRISVDLINWVPSDRGRITASGTLSGSRASFPSRQRRRD